MAFISLPVVTVQPDFHQVITDVDQGLVPIDNFWVSCYKTGETSVHAKVDVELDEVDRSLVRFTPRDGDIEFARIHNVCTYKKYGRRHISLLTLDTTRYRASLSHVNRSTSHRHPSSYQDKLIVRTSA